MGQGKRYNVLIIVAFLLVALVMGFTGGLNIGSFKKNYADSLVAGHAVAGIQYVRKIEYALKYGKPLGNFFGLTEILQEAREESSGLTNLRVILNDGTIVADLNQAASGRKLPASLLDSSRTESDQPGAYTYLQQGREYHIFIPIHGPQASRAGSMELIFDASMVSSRINQFARPLFGYALLLGLLAIAGLILAIVRLQLVTATGEIQQKRFLIIMGMVLGLIQIAFGAINYSFFKQVYTEIARDNSLKTAVLIQKDINRVIDKGVTYQDLDSLEGWLKDFITATPEIERIDIRDQHRAVLFSTHPDAGSPSAAAPWRLALPLRTDADRTGAGLEITISRGHIASRLSGIAWDMLTVLVTSLILMIEVMFFTAAVLKRARNGETRRDDGKTGESTDVRLCRPLAFMVYFSAFMSMTFIPVLMKELYQPLWGLSRDVIFGLPISVELFCGALAVLLAGFLMEGYGWKPVFLFGLVFFGCGAWLSGTARAAVAFIIARGVFGVGYGFCLLSIQGYVNAAQSDDARNRGFSELVAGAYAGINCGCVSGAMLAERIGYSGVFFVTLFGSILAGAYGLGYLKNNRPSGARSREKQKVRVGQFLTDRQLWAFFLFIVIPVAVCSMFLEYFLPLYAKSAGVSSADVGRVFLLNGLVIVYLGPLLSQFIQKQVGVKGAVILYAAVAAAAMLIFAGFHSFGAACVSAVVLGLATGFGDAAQNNYLFSLGTTRKLGESRAVGFLNVATKLGQTAGPVLFGLLMILGSAMSVGMIGWSVLGLAVMFIMFTVTRDRAEVTGDAATESGCDGK